MPYTKTEYPDSIKKLPSDARDIWIAAYNSAYNNYDPRKTKAQSREAYAFAVAWGAVKKKYHQDKDGKWVLNEVGGTSMRSKDQIIADILNEVGKRNSKADEKRLLQIRALIDELLSDLKDEKNESIGNIKGSIEDQRERIITALKNARGQDYYLIATFPDRIIYSSYSDSAYEKPLTYELKYHIEIIDDKEQIIFDGLPQPVELETIVKSITEAIDIDRDKLAKMLNEQGGYTAEERAKLEKEREARSKKYNIGIKAGGNLTKPKEWVNVDDDDFADPVNYRYPVHTADNARNARVRFANEENRKAGGYDEREQQLIWERIIQAEIRFGIVPAYDEKNPLDANLPITLKKKMKGYKENESIRIKPHRLNETLKLKVDILNEEKDNKGRTSLLKAKIDVVQKAGVKNENNRIYPFEVLKNEVDRLNRIAPEGAVVMCASHPSDETNQFTGQDVVAKINEVSISDDGIVSIPSLEFIPTSAGKDYIELIKAGVLLEASQRAIGTSTTKKINGEPIEFVESLQISGWDLFPAGQVSVRDKGNRVKLLETMKKEEVIKMDLTKEELEKLINESAESKVQALLEVREKELNEQAKKVEQILNEQRRLQQIEDNKKAINERISNPDFKWNRFNKHQQELMLKGLDYSGNKDEVFKRLDEKISIFDSAIASAKLAERGIRTETGTGYVMVEGEIKSERIKKLNEAANDWLKKSDVFHAKPGTYDTMIKKVLDGFDNRYGAMIMNEETVAANVPTPAIWARVILEQALYRLVSAEVMDIGVMTGLVDTIGIEKYSEPLDADINALEVDEGADIAQAGLTISPYTIYATTKKLATKISYEAMLSAKSLGNYDLEGKNLAALAKDLSRRIDRKNFAMMVAMADTYSAVKVTTPETLTQVGTTKKWYSAHMGWVEKEYIKKEDTATNIRTAKIVDVGTDATSTLQKVEVIDSSVTPKTLVRGYLQPDGSVKTEAGAGADYYVLYADGMIVLADSPITPGLTPPYKAKYTYTTNATVIRINDASTGAKLTDRLDVLRQKTVDAIVLIQNRYYEPNFAVAGFDLVGLLTGAKQFTEAGRTPAETLTTDNRVMTWAGLPLLASAVIRASDTAKYPNDVMIIGQKGAAIQQMFDPLSIEGPILTGKAQKVWEAKMSSAEDVPIKEKLSTVKVGRALIGSSDSDIILV